MDSPTTTQHRASGVANSSIEVSTQGMRSNISVNPDLRKRGFVPLAQAGYVNR